MTSPADAASFAAATGFLRAWFASFGGDVAHEIEARVTGGVTPAVFARVRARLTGAAAGTWSSTREEVTVDVIHAGGTRGTVRGGGALPTFVRKQQLERVDLDVPVGGGADVAMRLACAAEAPAPQPPQHDAPVRFRVKRRTTFTRKGEFNYDLTEVRTGDSVTEAHAAAPAYEVELEWCAQAAAANGAYAHAGGGNPIAVAEHLAEKFRAKLLDVAALVHAARVAEAAGGGAG